MDLFVGRTAEITNALELLQTIEDGVVLDVIGVHGIGKSLLLKRLAEKARELDRTQVFQLDMGELGAGFHGSGANASPAVLWETFEQSRKLMQRIADLPARQFDTFRQTCQYQSRLADDFRAQNDIVVGRRSSIEKMEIASTVNVSEEAVKQRIREAQAAIDTAFVDAWSSYTARRRVLFTVDSFDQVADDELGHWTIRMALQLPKTLVVISRTPSEHDLGRPGDRFKQIFLTEFSTAEVADYLALRFLHDTWEPEITQVVHRFTHGHPGGTALAADLVAERDPSTISPRTLSRTLERLPEDPHQKWADLVRLILASVERRPVLRTAVDAIALTSTFDAPLLGKLIEADDHGDTHARSPGEIISRLRELRLLQQLPTLSGSPSERFRLHEFIRLSVASRVRTDDPQHWRELHRRAAEHYFDLLLKWEEGTYKSYGSWYRFEEADWQHAKREWLHHSAQLPEQDELTRARFTLVFLEAFWWWGYYLPFPFNRRLLEDWDRTSAIRQRVRTSGTGSGRDSTDPDRQLGDALTFLLDNYPVSHLKPATAPWNEIRSRLLLIRRLCGLRQPTPSGGSSQDRQEYRRVDALITIILAHTRRFRDPHDPKATAYYSKAISLFDDLQDAWTVAWLLYEQSDLALEAESPELAIQFISRAAAQARDLALRTDGEWDHELLANMFRARADADWSRGRLEKAATGYGYAVAHAYWFQGLPHAPDEYTQQFYLEITTRAAERIHALGPGSPEGPPFIEVLCRAVPGGSAAAPADTARLTHRTVLRETLFPPGPSTDELWSEDTPFMERWNELYEEEVDRPPRLDLLTD